MLSRAASRIVKNEAMDSSRWSAYKPRSGRYHHRHRGKGGYPLDAANNQPACISIT
jgi:hypothetical protein